MIIFTAFILKTVESHQTVFPCFLFYQFYSLLKMKVEFQKYKVRKVNTVSGWIALGMCYGFA